MSGTDSPLATPLDLVTIREAAQAVGLRSGAVHSWIARGMLTAQASRQGRRRVSLAAVQALCVTPEPQAPEEALLVSDVAVVAGVPTWRITGWLRQGLLPNWQSPHGLLVRLADVTALAERLGRGLPPKPGGAP